MKYYLHHKQAEAYHRHTTNAKPITDIAGEPEKAGTHKPMYGAEGLLAAGYLKPGDDYFDEEGNYIGTDHSKTNYIRILDHMPFFDTKSFVVHNNKIVRPMALRYSTRLDKANFKAKSKRKIIEKIASYYYHLLGGSGQIAARVNRSSSMATNHYLSPRLSISIRQRGVINDSSLADKYSLVNTIVHERHHLDHHKDKKVELMDKNGSETHLEAYWSQINHYSWRVATEEFRNKRIAQMIRYIAYVKDPNKKQALLNKFQNKLGITILQWGSGESDSKWKIR